MNKSFVQASFLRNIRELSLAGPSCSVGDLAEVFSLPSLRSLRIERVIQSERDQGLAEWMFQPKSNCISTLALTSSRISRQTLRQVLHSCTALKDFTYIEAWGGDRDSKSTITWVTQDFDSLIKILSPFHETLRTLKLRNGNFEQMPTKHSRIRTLTQFTTLEHFSTVMFAITNNGSRIQEILPESLIELELSDTSMETDRDEVNDILWGLSDAKLKRLPNLSRFALTLDDWNHSYVKFEKQSINGVEFCFGSPKGCLIEASGL
jgi:hypothetical protein